MTTLSYTDLIRRLYDLERLAQPPLPGERGGCFSSYDRASRYDAASGQYLDWNANADGTGYIRHEGDSIVAFEATGPGVIWRVWSALPGTGHIRIFIDDHAEPLVDLPFRDFFERFGDEIPPLNFPQLAPTLSRGRNRFIPIPYNQRCTVLLEPGWGAYYHFTYTTFPPGTQLPDAAAGLSRTDMIALAEADRILAQRGWRTPPAPGETDTNVTLTVAPHSRAVVAVLDGPQAIHELRMAVDRLTPPDDRRILRELALSITWDDDPTPAVWAPLGDFFGAAPGLTPYRALPLGMNDNDMYSRWYMPFGSRATIVLHNDGDTPQTLRASIRHAPLRRPADELLRFHAKWHRDAFVERTQHSGRTIDWPLLLAAGRGRFCGVQLHVWNRWQPPPQPAASWWYGRWNEKSIDWWWGEGDEKFFVDGEQFPSTFGTGSEDYIGFAWAAEPPFPTFESAYACMPWIELDANGHTSVNRFHICDDIPFQQSFEGCIEKYWPNRWGDGNACLYAAVAYWYQEAGTTDIYEPQPLGERYGYWE
ncbi:MAG TPA: DUF2961 domain-containing protein [Roseiflexaceae bacterium]|nr:DUF2961 domain-containing protein [Roseiflexaceae bacterium]